MSGNEPPPTGPGVFNGPTDNPGDGFVGPGVQRAHAGFNRLGYALGRDLPTALNIAAAARRDAWRRLSR